MKPSTVALTLVVALASNNVNIDAFTPTTPTFVGVRPQLSSSSLLSSTFVCKTDYLASNKRNASISLYAGFIGQDDDENNDIVSAADKYVQKMSPEERRENLSVMKQIFKHDLADLQRRRDYAGWVEAKKDLKKRQSADPWFDLNTLLKDAIQMDELEEAARLKILIEDVDGPPPGVKMTREYAVLSDIYGDDMSLSRAESIAKMEQSKKNAEVWKRMMAERKANMEAEEEDYWNDPLKEEKEAKLRREKTMGKIYGEIEERRKKMETKAKEIKEKYKNQLEDQKLNTPLDRAIAETKKILEAKKMVQGKQQLESASSSPPLSYSENGRPRLPGDKDMTMGEIEGKVFESSDVTTDDVRIEVESSYSESKSDPLLRKHCFKYTIRITNLSATSEIQLTSRKFEIQTVGMSRKDSVKGDGVTGRQPTLKPREVFEYTSTAPLSVRPLGTTVVAARMSGSYMYKVIQSGVTEGASEELEAELGKFHFVFPSSQRVRSIESTDNFNEN